MNFILFQCLEASLARNYIQFQVYQSERRINKLKAKVNNLEIKITERKIIEKAKGIIMRDMNLNEEEAYRYIQKNSMNLGLKMIDYAKNIIS